MKKAILVAALFCIACAVVSAACSAAAPMSGARGPVPWWDDRTAGWIGGIEGTVVGILGGVIGTLAGMGKARRFVLGLAWTLVVYGAISEVLGLVAVLESQPCAVYYPLLLGGLILTLVFGSLMSTIRRRYAEVELQKMRVRDAEDGGAS